MNVCVCSCVCVTESVYFFSSPVIYNDYVEGLGYVNPVIFARLK